MVGMLAAGLGWLGFSAPALGAVAQPLTFGAIITSAISEPGEQDAYSFEGAAGQRLYFDALSRGFLSITVRLISPSEAPVWEVNRATSAGPFTLTESGTYRLAVDGALDTTGDYSFRVHDLATARPLPLGGTLAADLSPPTGADVYRLEAPQAGQRLRLSALTSTSTQAEWLLVGPADQLLVSRNIRSDLGDVVLPSPGRYALIVRGLNPVEPVFHYDVAVRDVSDAPVAPAGLGELKTGAIAAGQRETFTFSANAGAWLYFDSQDRTSSTLLIDLADPASKLVFTVSAASDTGPHVLPASGTYTVTVRGNSPSATGNYRFRLQDLASVPSLSLNTLVEGTLDPGVTTTVYQFTGQAGQRLYYDGTEKDGVRVTVEMRGPTGSVVHLNRNSETDLALFTLAVGGTYFLFLEGNVATPARYQFRLLDLVAQPDLPRGPVVADTLAPFHATIYKLTGAPGDRLFFDGRGPESTASAALYGPANDYLGGAALTTDFETILTRPGLHALVVTTESATPVPFTFQVITPDAPTAPLALGVPVTGRLDQPGAVSTFTFYGVPGQRLYYDGLDTVRDAIIARLVTPTGAQVSAVNSDDDHGPFTLADEGLYSLVIDATGATTGNFSFRLLDVAQEPTRVLALDTPYGTGLMPMPAEALQVTGSYFNRSLRTDPPQDDWRQSQTIAGTRTDAQIHFTRATWGARASVGLTAGTDANWDDFSVQWDGRLTITLPGTHLYLRSDDGSRLWIDLNHDGAFDSSGPEFLNNNWGTGQPLTLSAASVGLAPGTYTFRVQYEEGNGDNAISLLTDNGVALAPGVQTEILRFDGLGGQRLYFDGLGSDTRASWYLYGPANEAVSSANLINDFEVVLPRDGQYVLVLSGSGAEPIPYAFRVGRSSLSTAPLTLGQIVRGELGLPGEQDAFTFNGRPGQRLYFDALDGDFDAIYVRLTAPSGAAIFNQNADSDTRPFTLTETGQYTLLFDGIGATTGDYAFQLLDFAQLPTRTLALQTATAGTLEPGWAAHLFRFPGLAGQRLYFDARGPDARANWALYGPANETLANQNLAADFEKTLRRDGEHVLVLEGNAPANAAYAFYVFQPQLRQQPLELGATVSDALATPGEQHLYVFEAALGQQLFYDALQGDFEPFTARLYGPSGQPVGLNSNSDSDAGPFTLLESGPYALLIDGDGATTGSYSFRLLDLVRQPSLPFDTRLNGTLEPGFSVRLFRFAGRAGQLLFFDGSPPSVRASWYLYGPGNETIASANLGGDFEIVLNRSGLFTLLLSSSSAEPVNFSVRVSTPDDSNTPPAISPIHDQATPVNTPTVPIAFTVGDVETPLGDLALTVRSSNPSLVPAGNFFLTGTGADRALIISPAPNQAGLALITVTVRDGGGAETSTTFLLTVNPQPPRIVQQPAGQKVLPGSTVAFTVLVEGTGPFTYQWRKNGVNLPGADGPSLRLVSVQPSDAGAYSVAVASPFGSANSQPALLTLEIDALPLADNFAAAGNVSDVVRVGSGGNATATREPGEPEHAGKPGGKSMWLRWTAPADGIVTFSTSGSDFDTTLAAYTGSDFADLTAVAGDDDHGGYFTSQVVFTAANGRVYHIAIDGLGGASGNIVLGWALELTPEVVPQITRQPSDQTVAQGADVTFTVQATGLNPAYQWFFNNAALPDATGATLLIANAQPEDVGVYHVAVSSGARSVLSQPARLQINLVDGAPAPTVRSEDKFAEATAVLPRGPGPQASPPRKPIRKGAASVARGMSGSQVFNTYGSTKELGEPNHCDVLGGASQWFAYEAPASGTLTVSTDGSAFDTVLAVYTGPGTDFESLVPVACDNNSGLDGSDSRVVFAATAGTIYLIAIDGVGGATGDVLLSYRLETVPAPLQLGPPRIINTRFQFRLSGPANRTFVVQRSTDLLNWIPVRTIFAPEGALDFEDPESPTRGALFYRAFLQP